MILNPNKSVLCILKKGYVLMREHNLGTYLGICRTLRSYTCINCNLNQRE